METYQPIFDAVRSRIGSFDGSDLVERIARNFDFSFHADIIKDSFLEAAYELSRPSTVYKPSIHLDGNKWCCLYGDNLQDGVAGFGYSPSEAMLDFDKEWIKKIGHCEHGKPLSTKCDKCPF